jgi:RNA polymerase sigma-70 factor (ECF subfamily)
MVDDAVQDVFLVVHRRLGEFEGRAKVRTWLFEILRRVAWRYRTKAQREATRWDVLPELAGSVDLEADVERTQAFELVQHFVDELDADRLHVFTLSVFGQLRGREIAEALGVNLNTVYARLRSAHAAFDRYATRLKAREANNVLQTARASRPSRARLRRTWAALALQVGVGSGASTAATAVSASWLLWAAAGTAIACVAAVIAVKPPPTESPLEPARQESRRQPEGVGAPATAPLERSVSTASAVTPPAGPRPSEPARRVFEMRSTLAPHPVAADGARPHGPPPRRVQRPTSSSEPAPAEPTPHRLAEEVAAVERLQAIADANGSVAAGIRRYRRRFPQGTLREEVEALAIEDLCRRGSTASTERLNFERRWPQSSLLRHLKTSCAPSISLQKPRGSETPSP